MTLVILPQYVVCTSTVCDSGALSVGNVPVPDAPAVSSRVALAYVNVHTVEFSGGANRGQVAALGMLCSLLTNVVGVA